MSQTEWHETQIRVRYKDTDRMGVVYYGNYLTFFEVGRTEFMRDLGLSYSSLEAEGYALAVTEAYAKYHANVDYDTKIIVKTAITNLTKVRVRFDYEVIDREENILVTGYTVHASINENKKAARIPASLRDLIEKSLK